MSSKSWAAVFVAVVKNLFVESVLCRSAARRAACPKTLSAASARLAAARSESSSGSTCGFAGVVMGKKKSIGWMTWVGGALVAFVLVQLWIQCISLFKSANYFGYKNHYGQTVGPMVLLIVLLIATPLGIVMVWKHFYGKRRKPD
ncbi:MAG: hypothetical protein OEV59_09655 [Deltaproteobacteria bacterium]|nr:hypothetical protein [Deltaproteobacteria bacterium]